LELLMLGNIKTYVCMYLFKANIFHVKLYHIYTYIKNKKYNNMAINIPNYILVLLLRGRQGDMLKEMLFWHILACCVHFMKLLCTKFVGTNPRYMYAKNKVCRCNSF
jgi:hypothetical protein